MSKFITITAIATAFAFGIGEATAQNPVVHQQGQSVVKGVQRTLKRKLTKRSRSKNLTITQSGQTIKQPGDVGNVQVRGSNNKIYLTNPDSIVLTGSNNTIYYVGSKVQIDDRGEDNEIVRRKGSATDSSWMNAGGNTGSASGGGVNQQGNSTTNNNKNNSGNNQNNQQNNNFTNVTGAQVFAGLVNVNVSNVNISAYKLVNVENVLNNSQLEILTQKIENSPGAQQKQDLLNNLLRGAKILNGNQIVVGVLSDIKKILYKNAK